MTDRRDRSVEELVERVQEAKHAVADEGRPEAVEKQHAADKLTARERVDYLCESFDEFGQLAAPAPSTPETADWTREDAPADGVVAGIGTIAGIDSDTDSDTVGGIDTDASNTDTAGDNDTDDSQSTAGRPAAIAATDFTVKGGSIGHTGGHKLMRVMDLALERGFPLVMLHDGGGHRIQEGLDARPSAQGDGGLFRRQTELSGWVPIVSAMMGPGFAAPTNFSAMADFVPMVEGATMGVAGPSLVKAALGVDLSKEELGGARFQTRETGMADLACADDEACLDAIRNFLSYLPRNARGGPPTSENPTPPTDAARERLAEVMPADPKKGYNIRAVVEGVVDAESVFEVKPDYARNVVTAFARIDGRPVGIVANNPRVMAGTIDTPASDTSSRFVSLCDAFGLPVVLLEDVPGILPGPDSERAGVARHSGKLPYELNRATVPLVNVVLRRGYGFGHVAMGGGRSAAADLTVVWPTAEVAAMGIEGAVDVAYRREIEAAEDPEAKRRELIEEFTDRTGAIRSIEGLGVDAAIEPAETRGWVRRAIERAEEGGGDVAHGGEHGGSGWPPKKHSIGPI